MVLDRGPDPREINEPIKLPNGGLLRIEVNGHHEDLVAEYRLDVSAPDNRILNTALSLRRDGDRAVRLVSNDVSFRVKASVVGIAAEELRAGSATARVEDIGYYEVEVSPTIIDRLYCGKKEGEAVSWPDLGGRDDDLVPGCEDAKVNEYFDMKNGSQSVIARVTENGLRAIRFLRPYGLRGRTNEQHMAIDLLMDPTIPIVALAGHTGTGKTLLALATGLAQTVGDDFFYVSDCKDRFGGAKRAAEKRVPGALYDRMVIYRPIYSVGRQDLGFLPGEVDEKLGPWMDAVTDAMMALSPEDPARLPGHLPERKREARRFEGGPEAKFGRHHFSSGAVAPTPFPGCRRGSELRAERLKDHPHPPWRRHQDRLRRRHDPNRQPVRQRTFQRPCLSVRAFRRPSAVRPACAPERPALGRGRPGGGEVVNLSAAVGHQPTVVTGHDGLAGSRST